MISINSSSLRGLLMQGCRQEGKVVGYGDGSVVDGQGCEGHNAQLKVTVVGATMQVNA